MPYATPPVFARFHHLLGIAMDACGWQVGAVHAFRDALRIDPAFLSAHYRLGEALARQRRWLEASQAFSEAARLRPSGEEISGNLILALGRAGRWDAVVDEVRRLATIRPHDGELYMLLGAALKRCRRHDEAIRAFRWAVRLNPAPPDKRFFLGEALLGVQGWRDVLASWSQALRVETAAAGSSVHEGTSPLHGHPGPPLDRPGRAGPEKPPGPIARFATRLLLWREQIKPPEEPFDEVIAREERERSILRVYRNASAFPLEDGGRPVAVYRSAEAARERRRRAAPGQRGSAR